MSTHNLTGPTIGFASALLVGLLSQQAGATEELVVYGPAAPVAVGVEQGLFQADVEQYIRSFKLELQTTLDQDLKRQLAPKIELASTVVATRG